jgi:hypothetical protein
VSGREPTWADQSLVATPIDRRRAAYYSFGSQPRGIFEVWNGALSLTFGILVVWVAYRYVPEVREILSVLPDVWNSFRIS